MWLSLLLVSQLLEASSDLARIRAVTEAYHLPSLPGLVAPETPLCDHPTVNVPVQDGPEGAVIDICLNQVWNMSGKSGALYRGVLKVPGSPDRKVVVKFKKGL